MNEIKTFLEDWGVWSILLLVAARFVTGVLVAVQKHEFKWFYVGEILRNDLLKLAVFVILIGLGRYSGVPEFNSDGVVAGLGALFTADVVAGIIKNAAHIFPSIAERLPSSFREPAKLRLGNPGNLPS
jgi:hypothetical protein